MSKPRPVGRPPRSKKPRRIKPPGSGRKPRTGQPGSMVGIRLDPAERARYQAAADREGVTLSEWLRSAAMDRADTPAR